MACRIVKSICKTESETQAWRFDYAGYDADLGSWGFLARVWAPGTSYDSGVCVRPSLPTGFQYSSGGGFSGATEPRWPKVIGGTVADGSITWTAEAMSDDSLIATIATSAWSAETGITVDSDGMIAANGVQAAFAHISGGTLGQQYEVSNIVTLSDGTEEESILRVSVE